MSRFLLLRLDAPMMSFGATAVDALGKTAPFPGRSLLTGLVGNALGYDHSDADRLMRLQARLRHAVRRERGGEIRTDYQTVDLGQDFLLDEVAWTTWGRLDPRGGSADNKVGTHIRYRDYIIDSVFTVALTLVPEGESPSLSELQTALERPARPLFLGRKCCLPASKILSGRTRAPNLRSAVLDAPLPDVGRAYRPKWDDEVHLWWPEGDAPEMEKSSHRFLVTDARDWQNQIHVGVYAMFEARVPRGGTEVADHA